MKSLAKTILAKSILKLPWGAKLAIYQALQADVTTSRDELRRLAKLLKITGFLVDGEYGTIQGDSQDKIIITTYASEKIWARGTNQLFIDLFTPNGGTYLDIGANIGLTTIPIARNSAVSCYAFEPDPLLFFHLSENIRRNCIYSNVSIFQTAIGAAAGNSHLATNPIGNRGDNRMISGSAQPDWNLVQVPVRRLDDLPIKIKDGPLGIKVDTQGYEPFVIHGGIDTLSQADLIVMEFSPVMMSDSGASYETVLDLVRGFDQAAINQSESDHSPSFEPSSTVCEKLRRFATDAKTEADYVDIIIRR